MEAEPESKQSGDWKHLNDLQLKYIHAGRFPRDTFSTELKHNLSTHMSNSLLWWTVTHVLVLIYKFIFCSTQYGNLLKSLVATNRVTYFILLAHMQNCISQNQCIVGRAFRKKHGADGLQRSKLRQGRNVWQWVKHAWLYSDLLRDLQGEHLSALASQQKGP